ncbi:hypothetical protein NBM05_02155 [Rothia sp. AR01]|uniref:Uncharacterized protein n=1 Tax=Rothia santali TaxID=2949643 RepID=A0A9X2HCZ6_9MICC|nr:hypothetical protein [Rothia santali]MCP3424864.1 hypothetical protein [Rothia santali]
MPSRSGPAAALSTAPLATAASRPPPTAPIPTPAAAAPSPRPRPPPVEPPPSTRWISPGFITSARVAERARSSGREEAGRSEAGNSASNRERTSSRCSGERRPKASRLTCSSCSGGAVRVRYS